jgi:hypothetical protein
MIQDPIFIIGTERSGSNLLRLILNSHSEIAVPHPPHIVKNFSPFLHVYGDLNNPKNFYRLVEDVVQVVNHHFAPWPFRIEIQSVLNEVEISSLYGIHLALYELFRKYSQKSRWACKSTFMFAEIPEITKAHKLPKFIHLARDPRDVSASAKKSIFSSYHPLKEARLWLTQQNRIEELKGLYLSDETYLMMKYEDLVSSPVGSIRTIMNFLELSFEQNQLNFFETKEAISLSRLSKSWENCGSPVNKERAGSFRKDLSRKEISQIETLLCGPMKKYGYPLETAANAILPGPISMEILDFFLMTRAEMQSLIQDKNAVSRWNKWLLLKKLKIQRTLESVMP